MRLEYYSEEKLKKEIFAIMAEHLDLEKYKVFFFGSRVLGGGSDRSDIDVGIEGAVPVASDVFLDIEEAVDALPTLYKIDVVDFSKVAPKFRAVATKSSEPITGLSFAKV